MIAVSGHNPNQNYYEYWLEEMIKANKRIAFAESCTGGLMASVLTRIPGASRVLDASVVSYSNEAKQIIIYNMGFSNPWV
jgi:nicotinamide mononucleotide (NMN) deamidase PncC